MSLRRYWIRFDVSFDDPYVELLQGCGVTAHDSDEALLLIQQRILKDTPMPPIKTITEDVDVSTLDANHVRPNMGNTLKQGIWFPLGYE